MKLLSGWSRGEPPPGATRRPPAHGRRTGLAGPQPGPRPGTRRTKRLEENVGALGLWLSYAELARLDTAFPEGATAGDRYANMTTVNR